MEIHESNDSNQQIEPDPRTAEHEWIYHHCSGLTACISGMFSVSINFMLFAFHPRQQVCKCLKQDETGRKQAGILRKQETPDRKRCLRVGGQIDSGDVTDDMFFSPEYFHHYRTGRAVSGCSLE